MTSHLAWLQGPEDKPDPRHGDQSASANAAEAAMDAAWGHLYWHNRQPARDEDKA